MSDDGLVDGDLDALRILLVEDDEGDAVLVEDLLSDALIAVETVRAPTLRAAIAELERDVDCVLLDLNLPDAQGLEAVERLRAASQQAPLIVLTGLDDEHTGAAAVAAGAQDYLTKAAVDSEQLARAIRYAIGRRQAEEARQQLRIAESQARERARLERGLAPSPLIADSAVWIDCTYLAGRSRAVLGGDFFDATESGDGHVRLVVGDVCGHGPDEAAIGVCLRAAWRALALSGTDTALVLPTLERVLEHERETPSLFTTICTLEIEPERRVVSVINAGHPLPLLLANGTVTPLAEISGPPIGLDGREWAPIPVELPDDWAILLYTDGIIEGRIGAGAERLGESGLASIVAAFIATHPGWSERPEELLEQLVARAAELNGGAVSDDIALMIVGSQRTGRAP
ncbi:MAG TPA: SpoIIE family protein phosphatase [Solirubrobacteraceae bacterium]|nr:SpoIIE family protein phosphatase [Solirubrobacteraceae bacterium]